jgi:site-specific DNA-methyltransferase (cytosine-N4-specific)
MVEPYVSDPDFTLHVGDAREVIAELPEASVDCVVTSPPYWGLRDYGEPGQLGREPTPEAYVEALVGTLGELQRVMTLDGTLWLNLGDTFVGKSLAGIPWRVAFAMQAAGWCLRSEVIWAKSDPMPESATDRPTRAHEQVFLLTRRRRYFYDADAVREPYTSRPQQRLTPTSRQPGAAARAAEGGQNPSCQGGQQGYPPPQLETLDGSTGEAPRGMDGRRKTTVRKANGSLQHRDGERWPNPAGRNLRSVWDISTQPYLGAHFATFPEALARRCILAGCPEGGLVLDPFLGSGTTALVARKLGRRCVGIELSADYAVLAAHRLQQLSLLAELPT